MKHQVIYSLFVFSYLIEAKDLPPGIVTCHRNDTDYNKCINIAIEKSLTTLKFGSPSLTLPGIDPLLIGSVSDEQSGATSAFTLKSAYKNAEIHGLSHTKIVRSTLRFKKFSLKSEAFTDRLDFIGQYTMNGQILILPIRGNGFANISMHEMTTRHELSGDYFHGPDGQRYLNLTDYKIKFKPKWVTFRFDNLFNGDKVLGLTMNKFMNDNWQPVFEGMIPGYEVKLGDRFRIVANKLFNQVPFDVVFPE